MKLLLKLILVALTTFSVLVGLRTLGQMIHPGATHYWVAQTTSSATPPVWSPSNISGIRYWWVASDNPTNVAISNWVDRIQALGTTNVTGIYATNWAGNGMYFRGNVDESLRLTANFQYAENVTGSVWLVIRPTANSVTYRGILGSWNFGEYPGISTYDGNVLYWLAENGLDNYATYASDTMMDTAIASGPKGSGTYATNTYWTNGVSCKTNNGGSSWLVGFIGKWNVSTYYYQGYIAEIAFFSNTLSSVNVSNLHNYATNRYGYTP